MSEDNKVCTGILRLSLESQVSELMKANDFLKSSNASLAERVKEWLCLGCRTVYPGPPKEGFSCVVCPKCGGNCGPKDYMELRECRKERDSLKAQLAAKDRQIERGRNLFLKVFSEWRIKKVWAREVLEEPK